MNELSIEQRLEKKGIRPTANRITVMRELMRQTRPVNLSHLEDCLITLDKSSIFRVLSLFADHGVVHTIDDGSGSMKYEVCGDAESHNPTDMHIHFSCQECGEISCMESVKIPPVDMPEGYEAVSVNYMVKGICPKCSERKKLRP